MEDTVDRAFELQYRKGLLRGNQQPEGEIPMFDFQDQRELENKTEKIKQYYTNWLQKGSLSEIAKAYDSLVKQHATQRQMIDEIIDFTQKFYDGNHNPLSTKTRLTEIFAKYGFDVK